MAKDLLADFLSYSQMLENQPEKKATSFKKDDGDGIPLFRLGLSGQNTKGRVKGYFITLPGEDGYTNFRRIENIKQFGATYKIWGSMGFKALNASDYKCNLDQETKDLLIKYNALWEELSAFKDIDKLLNDDKAYAARYPQIDIMYMYLTEGVEKPGIYLVTCKSKKFTEGQNKWVRSTIDTIEAMGQPTQPFVDKLFNNDIPKTGCVVIEYALNQGYEFTFSMEGVRDPQKQITLDREQISKLKPLSQCFVDETYVDVDGLRTGIEAMSKMIETCKINSVKAEVSGGNGDVFTD